MSDKVDNKLSEKDILIAETMIKLSAIETLLLKKGILTIDELTEEIKTISKKISDYAVSLTKDNN